MPLEPLQTDEKLDHVAPKVRDMDTLMLMGCGAFVIASLTTYFLTIWPFLAWPNVEKLRTLGLSCAAGMLPASIATGVATRRFGLPGACGSVAGALTTGIFLYLRIQQAFIASAAKQDKPPEYPALLQTLVPVAWILLVSLLAIILLPKGELPSPDE